MLTYQDHKTKTKTKIEGPCQTRANHSVDQHWPGSTGRLEMTDIPQFAWSNIFLPTLYDILGQSKHLFAHFSKGLKVVNNIQEALDLVWPGTDYKIQWSDVACKKVCTYCSVVIGYH